MRKKTIAVRWLSVLLALLTLLSAGCRRGKAGDGDGEAGNLLLYTYRKTEYPIPEPYYMDSCSTPVYDPETGRMLCVVFSRSEDGEGVGDSRFLAIEADGSVAESVPLPMPAEDSYAAYFLIDGDAVYYVVWRRGGGMYYARYDRTSGEAVFSERFSMPSQIEMTFLAADGDGNLYVAEPDRIRIYDAALSKIGEIAAEQGKIGSLSTDGEGTVWYASDLGQGWGATPIERAGFLPGKTVTLTMTKAEQVSIAFPRDPSCPWDLFWSDDQAVYGVTIEGGAAGERELLMDFGESGVVSDLRQYLKAWTNFRAAADGETFVFVKREVPDRWAVFTPTLYRHEVIDLDALRQITVAHAVELEPAMKAAIAAFNETSRDARVVLLDYDRYNSDMYDDQGTRRMMIDLVTGTIQPDIVIGNADSAEFSTLFEKGYCEDLLPYLAADPEVNPDNLFGCVLSAFDDGAGGIWALAPDFYLETIAVYPGLIGDYTGGWTLGEMLDFLEALPAGVYGGERMLNRTVISQWFGGYEAFIDREAGTCSFDSPLFLRVLTFAGNLGDWKKVRNEGTIESVTDPDEYFRLYFTGKVALKQVRFQAATDAFAGRELIFGTEDWIPVGYPTEEGLGNRINAGLAFVILKSSEAKDEAFSLVASFLKGGGQRTADTRSIPALKSRYREMIEDYLGGSLAMWANGSVSVAAEGMDHDYMIRQNGKPYLEKDLTPAGTAWFEEFCDRPVMPILSKAPADLDAIVNEELSAYFAGAVSAEDCAKKIQSRASIWLAEHQ
ncbi:MAG: hypothetical protein II889_02795 [Clostridia bacterium]|nr:hypothetical protein [Clostridia bacterium]